MPPLILLMLCLLFAAGCIRSGNEASQGGIAPSQEATLRPALELDFAPRVSMVALCAEGRVVLWEDKSPPYLILNATFCSDGRLEKNIKYMMLDVDPKKELPFKICKSTISPPGNYTCTLEAWAPEGNLGAETRACEVDLASFALQETNGNEHLTPSETDAFLQAQEENPSAFPEEPQPGEMEPAKGPEREMMAQSPDKISSSDKKQDYAAVAGEPAETTEAVKPKLPPVQ